MKRAMLTLAAMVVVLGMFIAAPGCDHDHDDHGGGGGGWNRQDDHRDMDHREMDHRDDYHRDR